VAEPTKAQKKRANARERRRGQGDQPQEERNDGAAERDDEQPLEAVKHAAKVAAAGAAVGAAAAAARALTSRPDDDAGPDTPTTEPKGRTDTEREGRTETETASRLEPEQQEEPSPAESGGEPEARGAEPIGEQQQEHERRGAAPQDAKATVEQAREQLEALLNRPVESVSAFERTHDGWLVTLEVVEVSRIPESTDVLASYEMELDEDRNLMRYARVRRYHRSQADRGDQA
jgi:gas vesicle protein GvpO